MVAMRYGSIPIARKTGGLADTVFEGENGLVFERYSSDELLGKIRQALGLFQDEKETARIRKNGMRQDFSWDKSAREYAKLYEKVVMA
jgi:starch synthase